MARIYMFDAYGTLFDVHSAVMRAGQTLGVQTEAFSQLWRSKQLEYSWTYTAMAQVKDGIDFLCLTEHALDFCLAKFGVNDPDLRQNLLAAYQTLDTYPDVIPALKALKTRDSVQTAIFTNGTMGMVEAAIRAGGLGGSLDHVISVEPTSRFKPDPAVYEHAWQSVGAPNKQDVMFVSSNRWDIAGARAYGFTPIWCNRTRQPDEYPGLAPLHMISDLDELAAITG